MNFVHISLALVLISASDNALAVASRQFACPESVNAESIRLDGIPNEWTPFVASPLYLHSAAPMSGPPEMRGDLADFTERRSKQNWSYTYRLEGPFPSGKWLQCAYGEHNQITLSQRLPDEVRACTVTYRKGEKAGQHDIKISCL